MGMPREGKRSSTVATWTRISRAWSGSEARRRTTPVVSSHSRHGGSSPWRLTAVSSDANAAFQAAARSARSRPRSRSGPVRRATASASPPGAAALSRRIRSTSVSDTDSDVPERAARPVSRSTACLCSNVAAGKVTVPVSGRPASSLSRARRTSHAIGSPPSSRRSLSSPSVTRARFQPADVLARPTATA